MKNSIFFLALILSLSSVTAQEKKPNLLKKVGRKLDSLGTAVEAATRPKDEKVEKGKSGDVSVEEKPKSIGSATTSSTAGTLHPSVVYLDNINTLGFKEGVLIVEKNANYSMIDAKGNTVIPFSKIPIKYIHNAGGSKDFFVYSDLSTTSTGNNDYVMNGKGEKLLDMSRGNSSNGSRYSVAMNGLAGAEYTCSFDKDFLFVNLIGGGGVILDKTGKLYPITRPYGFLSEGLVIAYDDKPSTASSGAGNPRFGARNLKNQWVVPPNYEYLGPFSEGYAVAGKRNNMGDLLYGFVDNKGTEVIPFKYTVRPGSFRYGRALIQTPRNSSSNISHAFINKKGDIVFEITREQVKAKSAAVLGYARFTQGLIIDLYGVTDTTGKWMDVNTYVKSIGLPAGATIQQNKGSSLLLNSYRDLEVMPVHMYETNPDYLIYEVFNKESKEKQYGIYWMKTKQIVPPVFTQLGEMDPVSKLFYAKYRVKKGTAKDAFHEGFINTDGVFLFLKKPASEW